MTESKTHTAYIRVVAILVIAWLLLTSTKAFSQDKYYWIKIDSVYGYHKIKRDTIICSPYATIISTKGNVTGYTYNDAQKAFIKVSIPYLTKFQIDARQERRDSILINSVRQVDYK